MNTWATETCCGCMVSANVATMYPLSDTETMQLFKECTNILYQSEDGHLQQHLCLMCYKQCEMWKIFKTRCEDTRRLLGFADPDDIQEIEDVEEVIEEDHHSHRQPTYKTEAADEDHYDHEMSYDPLSGGDGYSFSSSAKKKRKEGTVNRSSGYDDDYEDYKPVPVVRRSKGRGNSMVGNVSKVSHNLYMKTYRDFQKWRAARGDAEIDEELMLTYFEELSQTIAPTTLTNKLSHLIKMIEDFHGVKIDGYQQLRQFCREIRMQKRPSISEVEVVLE